MSRLLIIGLDGATFDLIHPWAAQGKLPNLQRLMEDGTWAPLESTLPPMTALNVTANSYADKMHVGLVAGRTAVPDIDRLARHLQGAFSDLYMLA